MISSDDGNEFSDSGYSVKNPRSWVWKPVVGGTLEQEVASGRIGRDWLIARPGAEEAFIVGELLRSKTSGVASRPTPLMIERPNLPFFLGFGGMLALLLAVIFCISCLLMDWGKHPKQVNMSDLEAKWTAGNDYYWRIFELTFAKRSKERAVVTAWNPTGKNGRLAWLPPVLMLAGAAGAGVRLILQIQGAENGSHPSIARKVFHVLIWLLWGAGLFAWIGIISAVSGQVELNASFQFVAVAVSLLSGVVALCATVLDCGYHAPEWKRRGVGAIGPGSE